MYVYTAKVRDGGAGSDKVSGHRLNEPARSGRDQLLSIAGENIVRSPPLREGRLRGSRWWVRNSVGGGGTGGWLRDANVCLRRV